MGIVTTIAASTAMTVQMFILTRSFLLSNIDPMFWLCGLI